MKFLLFSKKNYRPIFLDINIPIFEEIIECLLEIIKEENKKYKYKDVLCKLLVYTQKPELDNLMFLLKTKKNGTNILDKIEAVHYNLEKTKKITRNFVNEKATKLLNNKVNNLNNNNLNNKSENRRKNIEICRKYIQKGIKLGLYKSSYECCLFHTKTEIVDYESFIEKYIIQYKNCTEEVVENFKLNFKILLEDMNRIDPNSIIDFARAMSSQEKLSSFYEIYLDCNISMGSFPKYATCSNKVSINPISFSQKYFRQGNNKKNNDQKVIDFIKIIRMSLVSGFSE